MRTAKCPATGREIHLCRCKVCYPDWLKIQKGISNYVEAIKKRKQKNGSVNS